MASIKETPVGRFELRIRNKQLPKTVYATFDTYDEAARYGEHLEGLLKQGIVPASLMKPANAVRQAWTLARCIAEYLRANSVPLSDEKILDTLRPVIGGTSTRTLNFDWADEWIRQLKRTQVLAPSTIRHRHGALARCLDWVTRRHPEILTQNPLRSLKRGFATYSQEDARILVRDGLEPRTDVERDRRVPEDEEAIIRAALAGEPDDLMFFITGIESAMRMREIYTLQLSQISIEKKTIHLERSKNGDNRQVPMNTVLRRAFATYLQENRKAIAARGNRVFPYWSGSRKTKDLDATTAKMSARFRSAFERAGCEDLNFHDLRHEATCRLYLRTTLSDVLIAKITGHRDLRVLKRYASLRGSDLAAHLW